MSFIHTHKFKQYKWYEIITYNSKQIQIFSRTLEIRVQKFYDVAYSS